MYYNNDWDSSSSDYRYRNGHYGANSTGYGSARRTSSTTSYAPRRQRQPRRRVAQPRRTYTAPETDAIVPFLTHVLSWSRAAYDQTSSPERLDPLYRTAEASSYYSRYQPLIIEEMRASLQQGLAARESARSFNIKIDQVRSYRSEPGLITLSGRGIYLASLPKATL